MMGMFFITRAKKPGFLVQVILTSVLAEKWQSRHPEEVGFRQRGLNLEDKFSPGLVSYGPRNGRSSFLISQVFLPVYKMIHVITHDTTALYPEH